jgi:hypothetical protein
VTMISFSWARVALCTPLLGALLGLSVVTAPRPVLAATLVVDDDGQATPSDCEGNGVVFGTIQAAVNAAAQGDKIRVCPGTYDEQVVIKKDDLTVRGAGTASTVIRPLAVVPNSINIFGNSVAGAIVVEGATNVKIGNLMIDGSGADSGASLVPPCTLLPFYVGIYYRNSSGALDNARITGITSATACAFAVRAEVAEVSVTKSVFDRYGVSGIACAGPDTHCTIVGNKIEGQGPVDDQIQVGIQIRSEAAGAISGNVITDHFFIGAHGVPESSVGIFLVYAQPRANGGLLRDNSFHDNQINVQRIASAAAF